MFLYTHKTKDVYLPTTMYIYSVRHVRFGS